MSICRFDFTERFTSVASGRQMRPESQDSARVLCPHQFYSDPSRLRINLYFVLWEIRNNFVLVDDEVNARRKKNDKIQYGDERCQTLAGTLTFECVQWPPTRVCHPIEVHFFFFFFITGAIHQLKMENKKNENNFEKYFANDDAKTFGKKKSRIFATTKTFFFSLRVKDGIECIALNEWHVGHRHLGKWIEKSVIHRIGLRITRNS